MIGKPEQHINDFQPAHVGIGSSTDFPSPRIQLKIKFSIFALLLRSLSIFVSST